MICKFKPNSSAASTLHPCHSRTHTILPVIHGFKKEGSARKLLPIALLLAIVLSGCKPGLEEPVLPQNGLAGGVKIRNNPATNSRNLTVSVLTYNISALPWPLETGRVEALNRIGLYLGKLRERGQEPDIVLLQEAFISGGMKKLLKNSGYPNYVRGPLSEDLAAPLNSELARTLEQKTYRLRGEGWQKILDSGLYILSNYPIVQKAVHPFHYCAGWDCLANKGIVFARILIPGLPKPLDILNAHLNSRLDAGVSYSRSLVAHKLQVDELDSFTTRARDVGNPFIFGGDYNIRDSVDRVAYVLAKKRPTTNVRYYCSVISNACDIRIPLEGSKPWMKARELQGFANDSEISVQPVRIEAMFDNISNGEILSDHSGYLVYYRLTWTP